MKKTLITGVLLTAVATNYLIPVNAFAAENHLEVQQINSQQERASDTLSLSLRRVGSNSALLQGYGLVILQQSNITLPAMGSLTTHQKIAKTNVKEWLDEHNPKLIALNQDIKKFSTKFNGYYQTLYDLAGQVNENEQEKQNFEKGLSTLKDQGQNTKSTMNDTLSKFKDFKTLLDDDVEKFSTAASNAIQSVQGPGGDAIQLRENIKKLQQDIQTELTNILNRPSEIINGSINFGKKVYTIGMSSAESQTIDLVSIQSLTGDLLDLSDDKIKESANKIDAINNELVLLTKNLSDMLIQVTGITFIEDQVTGFAGMIDRQITTLEFLMKDWDVINEKMNQIQSNLDSGLNSGLLKDQLVELKKLNDEMENQSKQFEDFLTVEITQI
ncbi:HBL/NHE enterotoxin family protein [Bacillus cereus]|uniref:HBL/NHE enterotoxin family protein n=1 Tax=Bacillus cereus TaxID=1396 RepID=UPI000BF7C409|nr:HBL/NHE enterotoxin family protein [Bacillus cereus]PFN11500.1 enterotoxin [Bacillus cereus]